MSANLHNRAAKSPRWVIGVAVLLLFTQVQGVIPLLFAGLAWVDGEHHVHLGSGAEGYQVVLQHEATAAPGSTYSCQHQHCALDRILVAFANPDPAREADHTFSFHNLDLSEEIKHLKALPQSQLECPAPVLVDVTSSVIVLPELSLGRPYDNPFSRPPPSPAASAFIYQTVLRI